MIKKSRKELTALLGIKDYDQLRIYNIWDVFPPAFYNILSAEIPWHSVDTIMDLLVG